MKFRPSTGPSLRWGCVSCRHCTLGPVSAPPEDPKSQIAEPLVITLTPITRSFARRVERAASTGSGSYRPLCGAGSLRGGEHVRDSSNWKSDLFVTLTLFDTTAACGDRCGKTVRPEDSADLRSRQESCIVGDSKGALAARDARKGGILRSFLAANALRSQEVS